MAKFTIETTPEEQEAVIRALKEFEGQTVPVRVIANRAGMPQSRARYAILDLIEAGKVKRELTKAFNERYKRYSYTVL